MDRPPPKFRKKKNINNRQAIGLASAALILILVITGFLTSYTYVEPKEVAVIKNNLTGTEQVREESGLVVHLPYGLTDVFLLDRTVQVFSMTRSARGGDRRSVDNVKIKVADGSNVEVDVDVNYKIIPSESAKIIRRVGPGYAFKNKMIRSYARAVLRERYGTLTLENVADPSTRTTQNVLVKKSLNESLRPFGIEVTLVNTTNFIFNAKYERLVKEKKSAAQDFINQAAAQQQAVKEQQTKLAAAGREKNNALIDAGGSAKKRIVEADAKAKQLVARAKGEAYSKRLEGDRMFEVAKNEAKAIETEGMSTAAGIRKLADAYESGGIGLVKEALARKLAGVRINGRPYSLSERIDRLSIDTKRVVPAAAAAEGN